MRIDGKTIAEGILSDLTKQVKTLGTTPTLAVILVGDNAESLAYIRQKQKATEKIGGRFIFEQLPAIALSKELSARVEMYNNDPSVHGLIVQRPFPAGLSAAVRPNKDIDGFMPGSPYEVPIARAIFTLLKDVDIKNKNIVIVGRGETAGKPIAEAFAKKQCATSLITRKTPHPKEIMESADVIISCVGKKEIVPAAALKQGVFLISVGIWREEDGTLHGDYEEKDIKDIASYYTPTPGGVGPLNIACLMQNLVKAAQNTR